MLTCKQQVRGLRDIDTTASSPHNSQLPISDSRQVRMVSGTCHRGSESKTLGFGKKPGAQKQTEKEFFEAENGF